MFLAVQGINLSFPFISCNKDFNFASHKFWLRSRLRTYWARVAEFAQRVLLSTDTPKSRLETPRVRLERTGLAEIAEIKHFQVDVTDVRFLFCSTKNFQKKLRHLWKIEQTEFIFWTFGIRVCSGIRCSANYLQLCHSDYIILYYIILYYIILYYIILYYIILYYIILYYIILYYIILYYIILY